MIQGYQIRRAVIVTVLALLLIFVAVQLGRVARDSLSNDGQAAPDEEALILTDFVTGSEVRLTVDSPITAPEDHYIVRINVSPSRRTFELIRGYNNNVITRRQFSNTQSSYESFLRAINFDGFMDKKISIHGDDERGVCAEDDRLVTELYNNGQLVRRLWTASCDPDIGTLRGDDDEISELFAAQIPEFDDLIDETDFDYF